MKFSILIPAYKSQFLKECIESVLSQTLSDFEIIILNDASPENIKEIIDGYDDQRIHYYENEKNVGAVDVVDNWNKCLEYASGDYCMCIGDDDRLLPNCLEEYSKLINKYPGLSVYHGQTEIINENSQFANVTVARPEFESVYSLIWHRWTCRYAQYVGDFLYNTKKLKEKGGYYKLPLAWGSDDITAAMAAADKGIANTKVTVFQYRVNNKTISSTADSDTKIKALYAEKEWYVIFLSIVPHSKEDCKFYLCLKAILDARYKNRFVGTLELDFKRNGIKRLFFWNKNKKKFSLSYKIIFKAYIKSIV